MENLITVLKQKANNLRIHSIVSTSEAGSGHPTTCMSSAELVSALFFHAMRYDAKNPHHPNNDRFILSKGHAAPILYAAWAEAGIISADDLLTLRRIDSDLEGHPTPRLKWVDVATGSLGQGLSIGVGMALNGKYLDQSNYRVYVLLGDGETAEGGIWEAAALASHYKLNNLIGIVDVNSLGQSQRTMYGAEIDSYCRRFEAFGWNTIGIDGHNFNDILPALDKAKATAERPTMIVARTLKGKGVSFLEDKDGWHGKPIPKGEQLDAALKELGPLSPNGNFQSSPEPFASLKGQLREGSPLEIPPAPRIPPPSTGGTAGMPWVPPAGGGGAQPKISEVAPPAYQIGEEVATRSGYGAGLAKLGDVNPFVVALDGDVKNSTYAEQFMAKHGVRYFEMFIAEQNLVGAGVGLSKCGKIPFVSTFAAFLARAYDHIRMSAISRANIKYVGSHCGVSIGEDGPSQMGLEDLAMFRAIPESVVLYPSDAVTAERLVAAAAAHEGIVYIRTSRPKTPVLYSNDESFPIGGSKVVRSSDSDRVTVITAGVTLHEALKAYAQLKSEGISIRVMDLYSVKPVDTETLLRAAAATHNTLLTVEDHYPEGGLGEAVLEAVASKGIKVHKLAVNGLPRSGKPDELMEAYGISAACIVRKVKEVI